MSDYADLEIRILEQQQQGYPVELTLNSEQEFGRGFLDAAFLPWISAGSAAQDGERLFNWLLSDEKLKVAWAEARGRQSKRRIRLRIDADAPELHAIPWELLRDPGEGGPAQNLAATTATPFSRYLAGRWQHGRAILARPVRVLAVIASPDLSQYPQLAAVNVDQEWEILQGATAGEDIELTLLPPPYTLTAIEAELKKGYHVLHFVGHGAYRSRTNQAALYLSDENNDVDLVHDNEIAELFARQMADIDADDDSRLRLVFLSSCQTANRSPADAFRGLAPMLVAAGLPAVIAMQDLVPVETAHQFSSTFYSRLLAHGQVDLAANEARSAILSGGLPGAAIPVLFSRLRANLLLGQRGRISSSSGDRTGEEFWPYLMPYIEAGHVAAFIGPRLNSGLLIDNKNAAQKIAEKFKYPLVDRENLARVTQFVRDPVIARQEYVRILRDSLPGHLEAELTEEQKSQIKPKTTLSEMVRILGWSERVQRIHEGEIYHQLAQMRIPLTITTNVDNFMVEAMKSTGLSPRRMGPRWAQDQAGSPQFALEPEPSRDEPVIIHLNGYDEDEEQIKHLVLSEDDYLEHFVRLSRDQEYLLPSNLLGLLSHYHFLFLGFHLHDWEFRVTLQGLVRQIAQTGIEDKLHIGVQLEEEETLNTKEAMDALARYMGRRHHIDIYWGGCQQFVNEMHYQWQAYQKGSY